MIKKTYICDRCNKPIDDDDMFPDDCYNRITIEPTKLADGSFQYYLLCPKCTKEFKKWIKKGVDKK